jgi:hypothetical protein
MRISAQLFCLAACLAGAPAFAQVGKGGQATSAAPQTLTGPALAAQSQTETQLKAQSGNLGLGFNKSTERSVLPLAPIEKDQLEFSWKPGGKWGITLDLTSRSENSVLPKEEVAAGLSYQVTPRFRFGGSVTLNGDSLSRPETDFKQEVDEASVRLESAFSF